MAVPPCHNASLSLSLSPSLSLSLFPISKREKEGGNKLFRNSYAVCLVDANPLWGASLYAVRASQV